MYSLPQEIEVWYIIPAIRKELAKQLTGKYDMTFEKAGGLLGISKAAISQYLKKKRASRVTFSSGIKKEIAKSAKIIAEKGNAVEEIMRILRITKQDKCMCNLCKKYNKGIIKHCGMKPIKWE